MIGSTMNSPCSIKFSRNPKLSPIFQSYKEGKLKAIEMLGKTEEEKGKKQNRRKKGTLTFTSTTHSTFIRNKLLTNYRPNN